MPFPRTSSLASLFVGALAAFSPPLYAQSAPDTRPVLPQEGRAEAERREQPPHDFRELRDRNREADRDLDARDDAFARHERLEKGSYLGVATTPAPPALRRQLGLPRGIGLVVEFVAAGSPAESAGLRQFDVLHKLDEQILVNPEQLAILVRTYKPGDEVKLLVVRDGKPQTIPAKLIEKDVPPLEDLRLGMADPGANVLQGPVRLRVPRPDEKAELYRPVAPDENGLPGAGARGSAGLGGLLNEAVQAVWDDGDTEIAITWLRDPGNHRTLTARDKSGKVLFDGPIDTPEQRHEIPDEVRRKLKQLPAPLGLTPARAPATRPVDERPAGEGPDGSREETKSTR